MGRGPEFSQSDSQSHTHLTHILPIRFGTRHTRCAYQVAFLTAVGLFFVVWPVSQNMPTHSERWGLADNTIVQALFLSCVNTFVNVYAAAPMMMLIFGHWLKVPRPKTMRQPWRCLDQGLKSRRSQFLVTALYFGSFAVFASFGAR